MDPSGRGAPAARGAALGGGGGAADGEMMVVRLYPGVVLAMRRHAGGGGASSSAEVRFTLSKSCSGGAGSGTRGRRERGREGVMERREGKRE